MKTLESKFTLKNVVSKIFSIGFATLFAWWGMHFPGAAPPSAKADTFPINCSIQASPSPTPITDGTPLPSPACSPSASEYPSPTPHLEILPSTYQNPNGAKMAWIQYGGDSNQAKPAVLLIHGTGWNGGDAGQVIGQTRDIANAGFFAASVWYELAPNFFTAEGYIPDQPCHESDGTDPGWRMNLEVNDIKNYVKAMRADSRCNGWVAVVGGSAGATHAITVALDTNPTPGGLWPGWFKDGHDDRPDCAVMLSAIYDFSDWTPPTGLHQTDPDFVHLGMNNYAQTLDKTTLKNLPLNPVNLVSGAIAHGFKPIYMINSYYDHPTAYHQLVTMLCLLQDSGLTEGTDYQYLTIPGDEHSFHYWDSSDHGPTDSTVGDDVIAFLKAQAGLP
jgi:pimeloyl-ACP methyl ester carboxylesterase